MIKWLLILFFCISGNVLALKSYQRKMKIGSAILASSQSNLCTNKMHICVNLGVFSGISSCKRQEMDIVKS